MSGTIPPLPNTTSWHGAQLEEEEQEEEEEEEEREIGTWC